MLPKKFRLCKNADIRTVYRKGRSYAAETVVLHLYRRSAETGNMRFGFVTSKKIGSAVVRNRIRRRLRETIHSQLNHLKPVQLDIVIVARAAIKDENWSDLNLTVEKLISRAGMLQMDPIHENR